MFSDTKELKKSLKEIIEKGDSAERRIRRDVSKEHADVVNNVVDANIIDTPKSENISPGKTNLGDEVGAVLTDNAKHLKEEV